MANLTIQSSVYQGKLSDYARQAIIQTLRSMEGREVEIVIKKKTRSLKQNAYWFGILTKYVLPQFRDAGSNWSVFELHEMIMNELGYVDAKVAPNGKIYASRQHSSDFDTQIWEEFMERARALLAIDYGIYVPLPNEETNGII